MTPRPSPLTIPPGSPRYWTVPSAHGVLTFRHPYYGVAQAVCDALVRFELDHTDPDPQRNVIAQLPGMGLAIGSAWSHPTLDLAPPFPLAEVGDYDALVAYGSAVAESLQDADWTLLDMRDVYSAVVEAMWPRQSIYAQAVARSSFSGAPKDESTPS